ncbi:protein NYNRIN-like [Varanus komodoensis]|uniref:protein NYNRIN-like n=1 Tax=Varanus komodoensis TaxID=61221 RepID=UPI001CF7E7B7|nr:protein NYNRIN-like [Varanus komodoensis]
MRAIAATVILVKEAKKLTLGQGLQVIGAHAMETLLRSPPDWWISNARVTQYQEDIELGRKLQCSETEAGWLKHPDGRIFLPQALGWDLLLQTHRATHLGTAQLCQLFRPRFYLPGLSTLADSITSGCASCARVNAGPSRPSTTPGVHHRRSQPGEHWEIDFTEVKPTRGRYRYLLVFIDTHSGWVEAFPTKGETALIVARTLLHQILPRFGVPLALGSDNGPAFIAQTSKMVAKSLGIDWKLHCVYRLQSSGQVERMNRTLKETLTKYTLEVGGPWTDLLPFALLRMRCSPYRNGFTPFKIVFGRPPPLLPRLAEEKLPPAEPTPATYHGMDIAD